MWQVFSCGVHNDWEQYNNKHSLMPQLMHMRGGMLWNVWLYSWSLRSKVTSFSERLHQIFWDSEQWTVGYSYCWVCHRLLYQLSKYTHSEVRGKHWEQTVSMSFSVWQQIIVDIKCRIWVTCIINTEWKCLVPHADKGSKIGAPVQ